jgi:hypothetical protein
MIVSHLLLYVRVVFRFKIPSLQDSRLILADPGLRLASSPPTWAVESCPFRTLATFEMRTFFRTIESRRDLLFVAHSVVSKTQTVGTAEQNR